MRVEIRELLVEQVSTIKGSVYEPSAAGPKLEKPYLILREGVQNAGEAYADYTTLYEVWPYVRKTTFQEVDKLSKEVISTLHRKRFDVKGVPHYIEYVGTVSDDIVDEEWDALTRGLRFQVFSLAWLLHNPMEPDPVEGMKRWTEKNFADLQTNPLNWKPSDDKPALYWRQAIIQSVETMNWGAWITARLHGHIISPDVSIRKQWTEHVVRQLALDKRTILSDRSNMSFLSVSADSGYDPFQQGQVQLEVRYGVLKEKMKHPYLIHVYFDEKRGGEVHV